MWLTYAILVLGIIGTIGNNLKKRWCFILWGITNVFWTVRNYMIGEYAQSIQFFIFFILAILGWIEWGERDNGNMPCEGSRQSSTSNESNTHGKNLGKTSFWVVRRGIGWGRSPYHRK